MIYYFLFGALTVAQYNQRYEVEDIDLTYPFKVFAYDRERSDPEDLMIAVQNYGDYCSINPSDYEYLKDKQQ